MASLDLESLTRPVSEGNPCGPDLDAAGDPDFLNFFAGVESALPQSYFRAREATGGELRLFDPKMIDFAPYMAAAEPLLAKTRDIRLVVLIAKLLILNRNLSGFASCVQSIATLLTVYWDEVHPRSEDGDFAFRGAVLEAIDVIPTVIMPLQFHPIVQSRRFGVVSYRTHLIATGEATASEGETVLDAGAVQRVLDECDVADLVRSYTEFSSIKTALEQIGQTWTDKNQKGQPLGFGQLAVDIKAMAGWLGGVVARRSPDTIVETETSDSEEIEHDSGAANTKSFGKIASIAEVAAALRAVATYFAKFEPSSPARLLVGQCEQLLGKSFAEVLRILVPAYAEQAALQIGREGILGLPIERMAAAASQSLASEDDDLAKNTAPAFEVLNRPQALAVIDQVSAYFRAAEPSSPIPVLLERVRELGQRDFLSLLRSVLPADAVRAPEGE